MFTSGIAMATLLASTSRLVKSPSDYRGTGAILCLFDRKTERVRQTVSSFFVFLTLIKLSIFISKNLELSAKNVTFAVAKGCKLNWGEACVAILPSLFLTIDIKHFHLRFPTFSRYSLERVWAHNSNTYL